MRKEPRLTIRIGVISDTHGQVEKTREGVRLLESMEVEQVFHCGDIGSMEIVRLFDAWKTHFVLGNCDHESTLPQREIEEAGHVFYGRFGQIELAETRIALIHGDDQRRLDEAIHSGDWNLICHGHTHVARQDRFGETLVLNPGAIYRARQHSVALVELPTLESWILPV